MSDIETRISEFKKDLAQDTLSDVDIVHKHISFGMPYVFSEKDSLYIDLKLACSKNFKINPNEVMMVGSAKLGFSISPEKLWKPCGDDSDIDVVLISETLFEEYWRDLLGFKIDLAVRTDSEDGRYRDFLEYLFKGWLRPDLFAFSFHKRKEWFDFFESLSYGRYTQRKISAALFKNYYFFEKYHALNIKNIRRTI